MWRLVTARFATLREIETSWTLSQILAANEILTYQTEAEELAHEAAKKG